MSTDDRALIIPTAAHHILTVTRDADAEYGPAADITCLEVTDTCAEWTECRRTFCSARAADDGSTDAIAHGEQHRYFDEDVPGYWAVRSGECYAQNHGETAAEEFAEEQHLGAGKYHVTVEADGSTVILVLVDSPAGTGGLMTDPSPPGCDHRAKDEYDRSWHCIKPAHHDGYHWFDPAHTLAPEQQP